MKQCKDRSYQIFINYHGHKSILWVSNELLLISFSRFVRVIEKIKCVNQKSEFRILRKNQINVLVRKSIKWHVLKR